MYKLLLVIDMQNDFIDGSLGTPEARDIIPKVVEKIKTYGKNVIYTRDTHSEEYLNTQEGKKLPVLHCVKDTKGWQLRKEIEDLAVSYHSKILNKPSFGSLELVTYITELQQEERVSSIELVGLCTDICVISNAMILKAAFPECEIIVDSHCCAGVTVASHNNALDAMKMCQITII